MSGTRVVISTAPSLTISVVAAKSLPYHVIRGVPFVATSLTSFRDDIGERLALSRRKVDFWL
jgi:hypothetical protein